MIIETTTCGLGGLGNIYDWGWGKYYIYNVVFKKKLFVFICNVAWKTPRKYSFSFSLLPEECVHYVSSFWNELKKTLDEKFSNNSFQVPNNGHSFEPAPAHDFPLPALNGNFSLTAAAVSTLKVRILCKTIFFLKNSFLKIQDLLIK